MLASIKLDSELLRIACQLNSLYEKSNFLSLGFILFNKGFLKKPKNFIFFKNINIYLATVR